MNKLNGSPVVYNNYFMEPDCKDIPRSPSGEFSSYNPSKCTSEADSSSSEKSDGKKVFEEDSSEEEDKTFFVLRGSKSFESLEDDKRSSQRIVKNGGLYHHQLSISCPDSIKRGPPPKQEINKRSKKISGSDIANRILLQAKLEKNKARKESIYNALFNRTVDGCYPWTDGHVHLEGHPDHQKISELLKSEKFFWNPSKNRCTKKGNFFSIIKDNGIGRLFKDGKKCFPKKNLSTAEIIDIFCVPLSEHRTAEEKKQDSLKFDQTFGPRSFLDEIPLSEQFYMVMEEGKDFNLILQELNVGIYPIMVPQSLKDFVRKFHNQMNSENIKSCIEFIKKPLSELFNDGEEAKFKKTLKKMYNNELSYEDLKNLSYEEAFRFLLKKILDKAVEDVQKKIANENKTKKKVHLDPNIFDVRSVKTLKLIYEVMRHYDPGSFFAWLYCILQFIELDNSKFVGVTVDGPQKHPNSIEYFNDHVDIFKHLRTLFPRAKVTIHTLEYSKDEFDKIDEAKHELTRVLEINPERISHATMAPFTHDLSENLSKMQEKNIALELCLTSAQVTTGQDAITMPFTAHHSGLVVFLGTDDPGIVPTNIFREMVKAIENFDLTWEDVEIITRNGVTFSLLDGESLYDFTRTRSRVNGREIRKITYHIKKSFTEMFIQEFESFDWKKCIEYYHFTKKEKPPEVVKSLKVLELSEKQIKECQMEILLDAFKEYVHNNQMKFEKLGYFSLNRSNSSSPILCDREYLRRNNSKETRMEKLRVQFEQLSQSLELGTDFSFF